MVYRICGALALLGWCGVASAQFGFMAPEAVIDNAAPRAVAVGDVDGDGINDVVMLQADWGPGQFGWRVVLHGSASPEHPVVSEPLDSFGALQDSLLRLADLDNDGDLDVLAYTGDDLCWLRNDQGSLRDLCLSYDGVTDIDFVDGDQDGITDVVWKVEDQALRLSYGDGDAGTDYTVYLEGPYESFQFFSDVQVADADGDSLPDVLYAIRPGVYFHRQRESTMAPYPTLLLELPGTVDPPGFAVGDFNGDGGTDLVVDTGVADGDPVQVFLRQPDAGYSQRERIDIPMDRGRLQVADVNGDGHDDIVMLRGTADASVVLGNGDGTFAAEVLSPSSFEHPVLADLDGDGLVDLVESMSGDGLRYQPGRETASTDLRLSLGLADGAASVRIDNAGTASSGAIRVDLRLSARVGSVAGLSTPAGCSSMSDGRALVVACDLPALAPGEADAFDVPYALDATGTNVVTVTGSAVPTAPDAAPLDNRATARQFVSGSDGPAGATVRTPTVRAGR